MKHLVVCYRCGEIVLLHSTVCAGGCGAKDPGRSWIYRKRHILASLFLVFLAGFMVTEEHPEYIRQIFQIAR